MNKKTNDNIILCDERPQIILIEVLEEDMIGEITEQYHILSEVTRQPILFAGYIVDDWNRDLSPWEAEPVFGNKGFGNGAKDTLNDIVSSFIPQIIKEYELEENIPVILGGYSLAGLFSLWSAYQTDRFAAIMAASPSVWFKDWIEYARARDIRCRNVYLSLGNAESKTKNRQMKKVSECIKEQFDILTECEIINSTLEWNEGNHFTEVGQRCVKGYVWCMEQISGTHH